MAINNSHNPHETLRDLGHRLSYGFKAPEAVERDKQRDITVFLKAHGVRHYITAVVSRTRLGYPEKWAVYTLHNKAHLYKQASWWFRQNVYFRHYVRYKDFGTMLIYRYACESLRGQIPPPEWFCSGNHDENSN